ncbi:MAG TPA: phage tail sheath subtilisin-like domain-containing protein [Bryobacteraceae bacterium]|nr:phage tail sheath subtilisin-like domain-containing protein [Bryobacteraceae bacterium]
MNGTRIDEQRYRVPGVYLEEGFLLPHGAEFTTGVPLFLGLTTKLPPPATKNADPAAPRLINLWSQFCSAFGDPKPGRYLAEAVHGFFKNGGETCYVAPIEALTDWDISEALQKTERLNAIDLVCAPDIAAIADSDEFFRLQQKLVQHCEDMGTRFAILDCRQNDGPDDVYRQWFEIDGYNGAIYYPWIRIAGFDQKTVAVPPCGHIAGIYARTDRQFGVHKAPANEAVAGALDLARPVSDKDQASLNPRGVNCLRFFPGRGIRVWGARTLSGQKAWQYISVRRLFLMAARWMEWQMSDIVFEPNDPQLWARVERELTTFFIGQFRRGALVGATPEEAFYVRCNAVTNPPEVRESGQVVTEIGLAPALPREFVIVRLLHGPRGATIEGPSGPEEQI